MKKSTKNYFLGLGTVATIVAPVAAVVSCGSSNPEVPAEVLKQRELLARTSPIINNAYQEQLIMQVSQTHNQFGKFVADDFKHDDVDATTNINKFTSWNAFKAKAGMTDMIKKFVALNVYQDNDFLAKLADKLLKVADPDAAAVNGKQPLFKQSDLVLNGMYENFAKAETNIMTKASAIKDDAKFDKIFKTIWEKNINGFRSVFYKYLIVNYYLDTTKTHWMDVFINSNNATGRINGIEGSIEESDFVLGQALVRAKLAYNWKADLSDEASKKFTAQERTEDQLNAGMKVVAGTPAVPGEFAKEMTLTQQKTMVPTFFNTKSTITASDDVANIGGQFWTMLGENMDMAGFTGIVTKDLAKDEPTMRQVIDKKTYDNSYYGYNDPEKGELVKDKDKAVDKIKLTTPAKSKVLIEKNLMIMPRYTGSNLSLDIFNESTTAGQKDYSTLKTILFMNSAGASLYDDAIKYYSSIYCKEFPILDANGNAVKDKDGKDTYGIRLDILDKNLREIALQNGLSFIQKHDE